MATCVIVNNNSFSVRAVLVGPNTEARLIMPPNGVALVEMSNGKKGLVAFTNNTQTLFVLRQLVVTGTAIFPITKGNPVAVIDGVERYATYAEAEGDQQYQNKSADEWIQYLQEQGSVIETPGTPPTEIEETP